MSDALHLADAITAVESFLDSRCNGHPDCSAPHDAFALITARVAALEAENAALRAYAKHLETCEMCAVHGVDLCFMGSEYRDAVAALATPAGGQP